MAQTTGSMHHASAPQAGSNGKTTPGEPGNETSAAERATKATATNDPTSTAENARPVARARQLVGQLAALPKLARAAEARTESVAERIAHRRRIARATLDEESSAAETDWARVGVFGAGIAIGALIGAGAALLLAPATGFETRTRLAHRARDVKDRAADRWDDASDDLRHRARHEARRVKRAAINSRWAAEDAWEQRRRRG